MFRRIATLPDLLIRLLMLAGLVVAGMGMGAWGWLTQPLHEGSGALIVAQPADDTPDGCNDAPTNAKCFATYKSRSANSVAGASEVAQMELVAASQTVPEKLCGSPLAPHVSSTVLHI